MNRTKPLTGECEHCGGPLSFPAEQIGSMATCPRCRKKTELRLAMPREEPIIPRRVMVWTGIAVAILVLGLLASFAALKRAENMAARHKHAPPDAAATNSLP